MFTNLTQIQISGLIALVVSTPFLIKSIRNLYLTNVSTKWTKVSGTIKEISGLGSKHSLLYEYTVNSATYKSHKICFTNTNAPINEGASAFEKKYALHQIITVFYNPINPKQAVLEPGRKDGLFLAIFILGVLFVFGCLAVFNQELFLQIIDPYFQINS